MQLYHATDKTIDWPVYDNGLIHSLTKTKHDNGVLGMWCSIGKDWLDIFGPNLYTFSATGNLFSIPIEELESEASKVHYLQLRKNLIEREIDIVQVEYQDDKYDGHTFIVLNYDVIKNWKLEGKT